MKRAMSVVFVFAIVACSSGSDTASNEPDGSAEAGTSDAGTNNQDGSTGADGGGVIPKHAASTLTFDDQDPTQGAVKGTVNIGKASDESDIVSYDLYWASSLPGKIAPLATLPKTGSDLTYALTGTVPDGATGLLVFSSNAVGEGSAGIAAASVDHYVKYTDISAGKPTSNSDHPWSLIDTTDKKLLVVSPNNVGNPQLYRCNIDGSACGYVDISASRPQGSDLVNSAVIDSANQKLLTVAPDETTSKLGLFRCALDGTMCSYADISAGQGTNSGTTPSAVIDTANHKLLVATDDGANSDKLGLFRCDLDGTNCAYIDISAGQGTGSGFFPSTVIDAANNKLLVVTEDGANSSKAALFRCNLDGTSCTYTDISAGQGGGALPSAIIDTINAKLLVAMDLGKLGLFKCNLDGTSCTFADISAGQPSNSARQPSAAIDLQNKQLLVATENFANAGAPAVYRCGLDGTGCTYIDFSGGHGGASGANPTALIDPVSHTLLVVTTDETGSVGPALFSLGL